MQMMLIRTVRTDIKRSYKIRTFWIFVSAIALCTGCLISVFTHVVPVLTDIGIETQNATAVLATFALVTVIAQVVVGGFLDRVGRPFVIAPLFVVAAGGVLIFSNTTSLSLMFLSASLMGVGLGAEFGLLPYGISRYFGLRHYGTISGVMYGIVAITNGCMPVFMDIAYDTWGNYDAGLHVAALSMIVGALFISVLPKRYHFAPVQTTRERESAQIEFDPGMKIIFVHVLFSVLTLTSMFMILSNGGLQHVGVSKDSGPVRLGRNSTPERCLWSVGGSVSLHSDQYA